MHVLDRSLCSMRSAFYQDAREVHVGRQRIGDYPRRVVRSSGKAFTLHLSSRTPASVVAFVFLASLPRGAEHREIESLLQMTKSSLRRLIRLFHSPNRKPLLTPQYPRHLNSGEDNVIWENFYHEVKCTCSGRVRSCLR